jgi:hypothetical protein
MALLYVALVRAPTPVRRRAMVIARSGGAETGRAGNPQFLMLVQSKLLVSCCSLAGGGTSDEQFGWLLLVCG